MNKLIRRKNAGPLGYENFTQDENHRIYDFVDNKDTAESAGNNSDISDFSEDKNGFVDNNPRDADSDPFLNSLENLTPDDIAAPEPKKVRTPSDMIYDGARYLLLAVCTGVFIYSIYSIAASIINYKKAEDLYSSLSDSFTGDSFQNVDYKGDFAVSPLSLKSSTTPDFSTSFSSSDKLSTAIGDVKVNVYNKHYELMKSNLNALTIQNTDTYGWITVNGTVISYPVVQGKDNDYYLTHAYNGAQLPAGSIFVDYRCSDDIMQNYNTILYGHNMKNGLMFNGLTKYLEEDFFNSNPYIEIVTLDGVYTYEVFAIYETRYDYDYIRTEFNSGSELADYAYTLESNSKYHRKGIEFNENDHILTMSTCTNGAWYSRYAVHAKLISVER